MAAPENRYQKLARKHFLDADSPLIKAIYDIEGDIVYDERAINIFHSSGQLLKEYMFERFLSDGSLVERTIGEYHRRKNRIYGEVEEHEKTENHSLGVVERLYNIHFDYEALIMDKLVSVEKLEEYLAMLTGSEEKAKTFRNSLFSPIDGKIFFEESLILRLKALAHMMNPERFGEYTKEWYSRRAMTKFRLYDVLTHFSDEFLDSLYSEAQLVGEDYKIEDEQDVLSEIARIRQEQFSRKLRVQSVYNSVANIDRERNDGKLAPFLDFLAYSILHNEEMRLVRSRTFFIFSQTARRFGLDPMQFYMECNSRRSELNHQRIIGDTQ